jgi:hypothetical protein
MDDKEILHRVIKGFELTPAKHGFGHPYVTKTGAATPDLAKRISVWIKQNFPQSNIIASYEGAYKTINFRKVMAEHLIIKQLVRETIEEIGRTQTGQRVARDKVFKQIQTVDPSARLSNDITRIYSSKLTGKTEEISDLIKAAGYEPSEIIAPGGKDSKSSQFNTSTFSDEQKPELKYQLVVSPGDIKGARHEKAQNLGIQTQIQEAIKDNNGSIQIKINGLEPYTITKGIVAPVPGNLPADTSIDNIIFLQLKEEKSQQFSGLISVSKYSTTTEQDLAEINSFVEDVNKASKGVMTSRNNYKRLVESKSLAKAAIFGDTGLPYGPKHIQLICRGELKLIKLKDGIYTIEGSNKENTLSEVDEISANWAPYFYAKYSARHNQKGIEHCRFNFGPDAWMKNAKDPSIY